MSQTRIDTNRRIKFWFRYSKEMYLLWPLIVCALHLMKLQIYQNERWKSLKFLSQSHGVAQIANTEYVYIRRHDVSIKTHLSANESTRTNLNFSSISYLGGYADAFVFTVSIRVSVSQSNFWSFAMSAGWAGNMLFRNTSQYHPKEERKKQKIKKIPKILILQICQNKTVWLPFSMFFVRNSGCYR